MQGLLCDVAADCNPLDFESAPKIPDLSPVYGVKNSSQAFFEGKCKRSIAECRCMEESTVAGDE
jgi:hypothetical protein